MFKKIIVLSFIVTIIFCGCSNTNSLNSNKEKISPIEYGKTFSPEVLLEDLSILVETIETVHPNSYAYRNKELFYQDLNEVKSKINEPMSKIEFYKLVTPLVTSLDDGHTLVHNNEFRKHLSETNTPVFPLIMEIRENKAYFIKDLCESSKIPVGAHITSINNIATEVITEDLKKYISGESNAFREVNLERIFSFLLWLEYGDISEFSLTYSVDDHEEKAVVRSLSYNKIESYWKQSLNKSKNYSYEFINDDTCYLDLNSLENMKSFSKLLEKMFKEINELGIKNLIVDIRDNGGGDSQLGDALSFYISDDPLRSFSQMKVKYSDEAGRYNTAPSDLSGETYTFNTIPRNNKSLENKFRGRVCLLTNRYTFSSASMFSSLIKDFNLGIIIGEESGGLASCYGDKISVTLSNSGLKFGVSHKHFIRPNGDESPHGVIPDIEITQAYSDTVKNRDTVLDYTLKFLKTDYDDFFKKMDRTNCVNISLESVENLEVQNRITIFWDSLLNDDFNTVKKYLVDGAFLLVREKLFHSEYSRIKKSYGDYNSISFKDITAIKENDRIINYIVDGTFNGKNSKFGFKFYLDSNFNISSIIY